MRCVCLYFLPSLPSSLFSSLLFPLFHLLFSLSFFLFFNQLVQETETAEAMSDKLARLAGLDALQDALDAANAEVAKAEAHLAQVNYCTSLLQGV